MKKITIILISTLSAFIIMSSGYGLWKKGIIIQGEIDVVPDPNVIASLEASIEQRYREIDALLEEQRIQEEQRLLEEQKKLEEQRLLEEQKKLEEQRLLEEQKKLEEENSETEESTVDNPVDVDNNEGDTEDEVSNNSPNNPEGVTPTVEDTTITTEDIIDEVEEFSNES